MEKLKRYKSVNSLKEGGVGYELYSKGADRVVAQSTQLAKFANLLGKSTREGSSLPKRIKLLKELKKWFNSIEGEISMLEYDIKNIQY